MRSPPNQKRRPVRGGADLLGGGDQHARYSKAPGQTSDILRTGPDVRWYNGQAYGRMGTVPHVCRDGRRTTLTIWGSYCPDCGNRFTFTAPTQATRFQPNRRCDECKHPGRPVGKPA